MVHILIDAPLTKFVYLLMNVLFVVNELEHPKHNIK